MRVGIDIDNVTLNFDPYWVELYEEWFDLPANYDYLGSWDSIVTATHFSRHDQFFDWFNRAGGWRDMPWEPGAPGGIDTLVDLGFLPVFVTTRDGHAVEPTVEWHKSSPFNRIQLYTGIRSKTSVPCSAYVDDAPHHCRQLHDAGRFVVVFDQPWNQDVETDGETIVRATNWHEVVDWLDTFRRGGLR